MILKTDFLLKKTYYNSKQQCSVPPSTVRISNEKFPACLLHCVPSRCLPRAGHTGVCNYSSTWKSSSPLSTFAALLFITFPYVLFQGVIRTAQH